MYKDPKMERSKLRSDVTCDSLFCAWYKQDDWPCLAVCMLFSMAPGFKKWRVPSKKICEATGDGVTRIDRLTSCEPRFFLPWTKNIEISRPVRMDFKDQKLFRFSGSMFKCWGLQGDANLFVTCMVIPEAFEGGWDYKKPSLLDLVMDQSGFHRMSWVMSGFCCYCSDFFWITQLFNIIFSCSTNQKNPSVFLDWN